MRSRNKRNRINAEISMLNLIDVIFMLLIFFMIATTFNNYAKFRLSVPKTDAAVNRNEETVVEIIIDENGSYFLKSGGDVKEISIDDIKNEFSKLDSKMLESVTLTADEHLEYGEIIRVMGRLKDQNVKNVNLNIQKNNK